MKKLFCLISLLLGITMGVSGCVQKEPPRDTGMSKEDVQEIKKATAEIKNSQAEVKNTLSDLKAALADIQNSQKAMSVKLAEIDKKAAAPAAAPQARPSIDYNKIYKLPIDHSPVRGEKSAPVTIVEFSDFQCPYCSQLQATLHDVLAAYPKEVKLVFKHFPLPFHPNAMPAAKAAAAAGEQGKFWEMHDLIFQNFNKLSEQAYKDFAQQLGLNVEKFSADYASGKYDQQIQQDMALARASEVGGTPTLFINGKRMQQRSLDDFKKTIDGLLKK